MIGKHGILLLQNHTFFLQIHHSLIQSQKHHAHSPRPPTTQVEVQDQLSLRSQGIRCRRIFQTSCSYITIDGNCYGSSIQFPYAKSELQAPNITISEQQTDGEYKTARVSTRKNRLIMVMRAKVNQLLHGLLFTQPHSFRPSSSIGESMMRWLVYLRCTCWDKTCRCLLVLIKHYHWKLRGR